MPPRIAPRRGSGPMRGRGVPGRGTARGATVAVAAPVPAIVADPVRTVGVKRPGFGTAGRAITVTVNAFETRIRDGIIYQYDVDITPGDNLSIRASQQLFNEFQTSILQAFDERQPRPMVYDGRKIAFAMHDLQLSANGREYDVPFRSPGSSAGRPPKIYKIILTKTAEINTEVLHRFISGKQSEDNTVSMALSALNVTIRMKPILEYPAFNARSFFTPSGSRGIGAGIELWQGYFQSLRPSQNKMYTNIDISTGVMYSSTNLLRTCAEFLELHPTQLINLSREDRYRLESFIQNLHIKTTYPPGRHYSVHGIARDSARSHTFTKRDDTSTTVENYFRDLNQTLKYPLIPCIGVGKGRVIPMELCQVLPGQFMRKQIPDDKVKDMRSFTQKRPTERLDAIKAGWQVMGYNNSPFVAAFGLDICQEPMAVGARVLMPPTLKYGGQGNQTIIKPLNGQWNMRDKKFLQPANIRKWVIVIFELRNSFDERTASEMANRFVEAARSVNIQIPDVTPNNPLIRYAHGHQDIGKSLQDAGAAALNIGDNIVPNLIVVVLPDGGNQIYTAVKHFGDVVEGVPTQCLKATKCKRANPQFWANVMLKVNPKLGGINSILENSELHDPGHPTIVMGADVMHPPSGVNDKPSFTALVSSVDRYTARYVAVGKVQKGNREIIADLEEMVKFTLRKYQSYRQEKEKTTIGPDRLIFYRDGVSEGQFQIVLDKELPAIQRACQAEKVRPKITLVVVGKRHHIRMFPTHPRDADRSGNCLAGTTIDKGLGHPTEFDYYQLAHGGLLGTSRPAHYSVLYDENNFTVNAMQNLSFALTHVYARATRSVSIPAPVYYADIVCSRSRNHYTPDIERESTQGGSQVTRAGESNLQRQQREYMSLNKKMENRMYFM